MATPPPDVRRLHPDSRDRALTSVVAAFATDPLLRWVWPDDRRYTACATVFFGLLLDLRLEGGEVWAAGDGDAVAMWDPPGGLYGPSPDDRWAAAKAAFTDQENAAWATVDGAMGVPPEAGPHWYLGVLATAPARQRSGLGRAVLAPVLGAADRTGLAAYLETATESNVGFYRRLGFEPAHEVDLPDGGPRCWLLRRAPGATS
jgi:GNAT superfamily N-acetyltransferase